MPHCTPKERGLQCNLISLIILRVLVQMPPFGNSGHGLLAFHLASELERRGALPFFTRCNGHDEGEGGDTGQAPVNPFSTVPATPRFCVVLSDFNEPLVRGLMAHPALRELAGKGFLDFAIVDSENSEGGDDDILERTPISLLGSGTTLRGPLFVIANYVVSCYHYVLIAMFYRT